MHLKSIFNRFVIYFLFIFMALGGTFVFFYYQWKFSWFTQKLHQPVLLMTPWNGKLPNFTELPTVPPIGVMIENEFLARPYQKGLSQASIVYEAPTEGKITRFLAIFPPGATAEKVGPIRSARTYFLDWMNEYNGVYVHVGGNPDVLGRLARETTGIFNADQFVFDNYFKRENVEKTALEHTMFTTAAKLQKLIDDQKWVWAPPPDILEQTKLSLLVQPKDLFPPANKITIDFGYRTYVIDYEYDALRHVYRRFQAAQPHIDTDNNKQIEAATVVIQRVKAIPNGDSEGSISINTIGSGDATIFIDRKVILAKWEKRSLRGPTRFFYLNGEEIKFSAGPVWFEILPLENKLSYDSSTKIPILMYHHIEDVPADQKNNNVRLDLTVSAQDFESHLKWLRDNGYTTIPFHILLSYVGPKGKLPIDVGVEFPDKPIILSFDDGYEDAYTDAFLLLKKYDMRGSFAIITGDVGSPGYLTWPQIKEMQNGGMEFISHTVSHYDLLTLEAAKLQKELIDSKQILQEKLNTKIDFFVYPSGQYNKNIIEILKAAGYKMARTTKNGFVTPNSDLFELPTIRIHRGDSIEQRLIQD